ncbi:hypothetical protein ACRYCC_24845 [Actinomadura scrupuli]|uniref:hypothetical protein n=1 Tax=Actinomadura scrupuli TaxID=559629 RepID=UPI003D99896A
MATSDPTFRVAWRGYDRHQVDRLVRLAERAKEQETPAAAAKTVREALSDGLDVAFRGYDRREVDRFFQSFMQ